MNQNGNRRFEIEAAQRTRDRVLEEVKDICPKADVEVRVSQLNGVAVDAVVRGDIAPFDNINDLTVFIADFGVRDVEVVPYMPESFSV